MKWINNKFITAAFAIAAFIGSITGVPIMAESAPLESPKALPAVIKSISALGEGNSAELVIILSAPATYTSYKTTTPLRLVIDFSQTTQGTIDAPVVINSGNFKSVSVSRYDTDAGILTRMSIELLKDSEALISASPANPGELRVAFPGLSKSPQAPVNKSETVKPIEREAALTSSVNTDAQPPQPEVGLRTLTSITAGNNTITLSFDGAIGEFKAFRLSKPERYVVDLMDVKSGIATRLLPIDVAGVASARIGSYHDKTRVVFDSVNGTFPEAAAVKKDSAIVITLDVKPNADSGLSPKIIYTRNEVATEPAVTPVKTKTAAPKPDNEALSRL